MSAAAERVRITLDFIEVLDHLAVGTYGEFCFEFSISSDRRGLLRQSRLPEGGTLSISRHPAMNWIGHLDYPLWDGTVQPGEVIILDAQGHDIERLTRNGPIQSYRREFSGSPCSWAGRYGPFGEGTTQAPGPDGVEQWRLGYTVDVDSTGVAWPMESPGLVHARM